MTAVKAGLLARELFPVVRAEVAMETWVGFAAAAGAGAPRPGDDGHDAAVGGKDMVIALAHQGLLMERDGGKLADMSAEHFRYVQSILFSADRIASRDMGVDEDGRPLWEQS